MALVRFAALAALVVWLGVLQGVLTGSRPAHAGAVEYACGAVLVVSLFAMKFLGPPPRAFVIRLAIVVAMLALTFSARWWSAAFTPALVSAACGLVLLSWYARE